MCAQRGLLLVATLTLLAHLSWTRSIPEASLRSGVSEYLHHSQNLLRAVSNTLQKARRTLEFYSCASEELDHEDITRDRSTTVTACLPLELTTKGNCLPSTETSSITTLCLGSIYEDLKTYQLEFKAMNETLLMDPKKQIFLDQGLLTAVGDMMQALNFNSETAPQRPSPEEPDFYKTKSKLCVLLHALRVRAVTVDRMMRYLNAS